MVNSRGISFGWWKLRKTLIIIIFSKECFWNIKPLAKSTIYKKSFFSPHFDQSISQSAGYQSLSGAELLQFTFAFRENYSKCFPFITTLRAGKVLPSNFAKLPQKKPNNSWVDILYRSIKATPTSSSHLQKWVRPEKNDAHKSKSKTRGGSSAYFAQILNRTHNG